MKILKNWIKILLINIGVVILIFVLAEIGLRTYSTVKSCLTGQCDGQLFTRFNLFHENRLLGLTTHDPVLGYKPNPDFSGIIHHPPYWDNVHVSIDRHGFRRNVDDSNVNVPGHSGKKVLTVGDSFTFGDQVHNSQTWPACFANKTGHEVWNGGVGGYGAAQALLRAEQAIANHGPFDTLIWSITVGSDFNRVRLKVRSNFSKPYIATVDGKPMIVPPGRFDPSPDFLWFLGYSVILQRHLLPILQERGNFEYDGRYEIPGENAAEIEEIMDFSFQRFANLTGTKAKVVLLQYGPGILLEEGFERRDHERSLIRKYAEKYAIEIIDSFDQVYVPEKKEKLWFGYQLYSHHTPYGNKVVCDVVFHWHEKNRSDEL
ncbi:SGNH/GDSL hydrolase family protein [Candidatus Nitrospira neomarina]|uniref:SGNH hydrolase-type esterase domain-containing protein n=1 Tax=Candidatus Nitrospira neomarina TaxID=3020899 RepID=A0AA96GDS8_9BACT|nr:hypothetical protein [Candidatus Nitrospira neomarina]WNM60294.1 hypothetical protein PQG83_11020 [Candidatus Nitrospira neomarina]